MEFNKELLLSKDGIREFLNHNKSELKTIANELNIGYSTLRNYAYGSTSLDSMPYRIIKGLTKYTTMSSDFLHPKTGIYLPEHAFYSLAKLAGRTITQTPSALSIEEYTKAVLLLNKRQQMTEQGIKSFEPRYFFIDLKYQDEFITEYKKSVNKDDQSIIIQSIDQLKTIYGMTDEDIDTIKQQDESHVYLKSSDPDIVHQLFSISLPRTGNEYLWNLIYGRYNIHLIITNKIITDGRISRSVLDDINNRFSFIEHQTEYTFDGIHWLTNNGILMTPEKVEHLKSVEFSELSAHYDDELMESITRKLINLQSQTSIENDSYFFILAARKLLHNCFTKYHNLDIKNGEFKDLFGDKFSLIVSSFESKQAIATVAINIAEDIKKQLNNLQQ